jgi:sulfide:quinone oxidoreductase
MAAAAAGQRHDQTENPTMSIEQIVYITPRFAVSGALAPEDFATLAALGFRSVINNRPDGEEPGQLTGRDEAALAAAAGLGYRFVPAAKLDLFSDGVVTAMQSALRELDGPVLAHCKAGMRSAIAWAAASSHAEPLDDVLQKVAAAGFDFDFLRDDFEALVLPPAHQTAHAETYTAQRELLTAAA